MHRTISLVRTLSTLLQGIIGVHILLYISDSLPLGHILFSIICHIVYLQNFSATWPVISLSSPSFLASCILAICDHFLWFFYFARVTHDARQRPPPHRGMKTQRQLNAPSFGDMATFFGICVWLAPLFLFLSLSANDNALPTSGAQNVPETPSVQPPTPASTSGRTSLFRSLMSSIPRPLGRRSASRRLTPDSGLIAPSSPISRRPSFDIMPPSPGYAVRPGSPALNDKPRPSYEYDDRSPSRRQSEDGISLSIPRTSGSAQNVTLNPPPMRRVASASSGLANGSNMLQSEGPGLSRRR